MVNKKNIETVNEIQTLIEERSNVIMIDFSGVKANDMVSFRKRVREIGAYYKVYKNRLFYIAAKNSNFPSEISDYTVKNTGFIFIEDDPTEIAKELKLWKKKNDKFSVKGGYYAGKILTAKDIEALANIPSKDELVSKLVYVISYPIRSLVGVLKANQRNLVLDLKQISEKK